MRKVITDLQAQLVSLRDEAGHVVSDLEQRLSQHLETRLSQNQAEATATATHAAHVAKPPFKPVRPQRFKGNQDGPKILEWLHQAEVYLRATNMEDQETAVFTSLPSWRQMRQSGGGTTTTRWRKDWCLSRRTGQTCVSSCLVSFRSSIMRQKFEIDTKH